MNEYQYRKDGWPLCPQCGEDELASTHPVTNGARRDGTVVGHLVRQPKPTDPMRCYLCKWEGEVPPAPRHGYHAAQT